MSNSRNKRAAHVNIGLARGLRRAARAAESQAAGIDPLAEGWDADMAFLALLRAAKLRTAASRVLCGPKL